MAKHVALVKSEIFDKEWWKAAFIRALRTALVVAVPYIPMTTFAGDVPYLALASAGGLAAVLSLLTSLAGLAEVEGETQTWYFAILSRVVKTVAQALIAGVGTAVLITDVDWAALGNVAIVSGFGSLLLGILGSLPEADKPKGIAAVTTVTVNNAGEQVEQAIPVVATVAVADETELPLVAPTSETAPEDPNS